MQRVSVAPRQTCPKVRVLLYFSSPMPVSQSRRASGSLRVLQATVRAGGERLRFQRAQGHAGGWGKPVQPIDGDGEGGPVKMSLKVVFVGNGGAVTAH